MKYVAKLAPRAVEQIRVLDAQWQSQFMAAIEDLCADPVQLSQPSYLPHPMQFQIFQRRLPVGDQMWELTVYFRYAPDEVHLWIAGFSFRPDLTQEPP